MIVPRRHAVDASDCTQRVENICNGLAETMGSKRDIMILFTENTDAAVVHGLHIVTAPCA